jgi:tetratricopeptide (TPR) repeat protein
MRVTLVPLACAVLAAFSVSALADDRSKCLDARDHTLAIKGCSEIIRRDPKDAIAYYMRGNALAKNGDLGQAIADFSKAIALNPRFAPAYDSRAATYVAKGDYTRAVADVTKAGEVAPRKPGPVKAKVAAPAKVSSWASPKVKDKSGGEPTFNPFRDSP